MPLFLYVAMMIGCAALGAWVLYTSRDLIRQAVASYRWSATEGLIVDLLDDSFSTAGINRWHAGVVPVACQETAHVYEYQVDGRTYRSSVYCFGAHAERAEAKLAIGSKVKVYYDPHNPVQAVLKRGLRPSMFFGPFLIVTALYIAFDLLST